LWNISFGPYFTIQGLFIGNISGELIADPNKYNLAINYFFNFEKFNPEPYKISNTTLNYFKLKTKPKIIYLGAK